jgi:transposase, IS605 orfB family
MRTKKTIVLTPETVGVRTLRLPLVLSDEQFSVLAPVFDLYNQVWGKVVSWCNRNKTVNRTRLQKELYHQLRGTYPELPSQYVSILLREGAGAVKSWNSNNPKRRWGLKAVRRKKTLSLDARLFSVRGRLLTVSTRVKTPRLRLLLPETPAWFTERYPEGKLNAAQLGVTRSGKPYINLIYRVPQPTQTPDGETLGVDRGLYKIAVTSKGGEYTSNQVRAVRRRHQHTRATLQQKGTRSAKRRLKAMSGREKRFMSDVNHCVSKHLAHTPSIGRIALENLTGIRRNRCNKTTRKWLGQWAFHQLEFNIIYKAHQQGIEVALVDPAYTSQRCSTCGYTAKNNRRKGTFACRSCGFIANADVNAAINIRDKSLLPTP